MQLIRRGLIYSTTALNKKKGSDEVISPGSFLFPLIYLSREYKVIKYARNY